VRDLLVTALTAQGVDEYEIRDECLLADLNQLAVFRSKLRLIAGKTGQPFATLKRIRMETLPSCLIDEGFKAHGQDRRERKGSDLNDRYLASLAAYVDELYVDKRTAEDFRRTLSKTPLLKEIVGGIKRTSRYQDLAVVISQ
jgi:hypothetical protein